MKGKTVKKEKKKEKAEGTAIKVQSDYQKGKASKQDKSINGTAK